MVLGFLRGLGQKIGGVLAKVPSIFSRGIAGAGKVAGGIRKVGEVASAVSRGVGEVAPEGSALRKIGAIASQVGEKAGQIAGGIEKGAEVAGAIQKAIQGDGTMPVETEGSAQRAEVSGGAMGGYNKMRPMYMR